MTQLNSMVYELKNITDLCANNGLEEPEFRLTEVKSLMRFWWRALNFYTDTCYMKQEEEKIFGNSDNYKSPIIFKIKYNKFKYDCGKHKVGRNNEISCFKSGKHLKFQLSLYKRKISKNECSNKKFDFYDSLLKISLILGGVGKRSRRGCGVFRIEEDNIDYNLKNEVEQHMKKLNVRQYYDFCEENKYFQICRKDKYKKSKYPYVEEILISKEKIREIEFYSKIRNAIDNARNKKLQYNSRRLACPVYVTCYGDINTLNPIIIKLHNTNFHKTYKDYYKEFKETNYMKSIKN